MMKNRISAKIVCESMRACALAAALAAVQIASAQFNAKPVWDLAKDAGPVSAQLKADGCIPLSTASRFEIPCAAIQDFSAFTVRAKLRFNEMADRTQMRLFDQITSDAGWSFSIMNFGRVGSPITLNVNGVTYNTGWFRAKAGETHTFTIAAKKGMVVAYMDDRVLKRCFTVVTPASTPIKVGGGSSNMPEMKGVELLELKIYGPKEEFWAKGEPREFAVGYKGGKGWMVAVPAKETKNLPRLLYYGDSISHGYSAPLGKLLKDKAYLYHWSNFVGGFSINEKAFNDVATLAKYDMIVFNNGLHSLHWTPDKATDAQIEGVTRAIVRAFKKGAPQAKLVWLSTTPHTAKRGPDGKVSGVGEKNAIVQRINTIAAKVMKEENVDVIDGYGLLIGHLDLASGDQYHWRGPAYEILAKAIAEKFRAATSH